VCFYIKKEEEKKDSEEKNSDREKKTEREKKEKKSSQQWACLGKAVPASCYAASSRRG
jgi:hypothetical protein